MAVAENRRKGGLNIIQSAFSRFVGGELAPLYSPGDNNQFLLNFLTILECTENTGLVRSSKVLVS